MKSNLQDYPGNTNDERVENMLKEAEALKFNIIPLICEDNGPFKGKKGYSVWRNINGAEEGYYPIVDNWIKGFPALIDNHYVVQK
jgi:hypothetical protein